MVVLFRYGAYLYRGSIEKSAKTTKDPQTGSEVSVSAVLTTPTREIFIPPNECLTVSDLPFTGRYRVLDWKPIHNGLFNTYSLIREDRAESPL